MSRQEQIKKPAPQKVSEDEARRMAEQDAEVQAAQEAEVDLSDIDELLDEIDALLEENAQDFVANYIQKGGQ